ncbi:MAG TPA: NAD(P)-binding domain-containing protein [Gemmatimonadales bacterium]|nr:NAD(P)-binding domain-containing protein [Gemmatimonadales bacterium]
MNLPFLDEEAVRRHLDPAALIPIMEEALIRFSRGEVVQPVRSVVPIARHGGFLGVMPAYTGALGAKLVTFYPGNTKVPTHHALILLFHPETGAPMAVMDGRLITEWRTAAVSAVATKHLARTDAPVLGILGSGVQAESHLDALRRVRAFSEIRVWSPRNAERFARAHGVTAARSAEAAVREADVVVVAVNSQQPVLEGAWLKAGAHVNAIGATRPDWRELDDDVLRRATIVVDSREAAARESGDVIASGKDPVELGEIAGGSRPGRTSPTEVTLFKSLGLAVEDVVSAELVLAAARASGAA